MCVDLCYRALAEQNNAPTLVRAKCFHTLDAYVRLITLLVKHSGETANTVTKVLGLFIVISLKLMFLYQLSSNIGGHVTLFIDKNVL